MTKKKIQSSDATDNSTANKIAKTSEDFVCTNDELKQLVKYYAQLLAELNYYNNPDYEALLEDGSECEDVIVRRIGKIAEILGKDPTNDIVKMTTAEFNRKMGSIFDREYTAHAVSRLTEY